MKKIFLLLFTGLVMQGSAQDSDYIIDMNGIGPLKIGMSQAEIERLTHQKFVLRNALDTAVSWQDSATAKYKYITVLLSFQRHYTADKVYDMNLIGIKTSSTLCKTKMGIGIGADKLKILATHKKDKIWMGPQYDDLGNPIKNKSIVTVNDHSKERLMLFFLHNKILAEIEVKMVFDDEE